MHTVKRWEKCLSLLVVFAFAFTTAVPAALADENAGSEPQLSPSGLNYDQYTPLKEVYKDYFMVGTTGAVKGPTGYHFNAYTPENAMKPQSVQNTKDTFNFGSLSSLLQSVTALSDDMNLIGHTLAWHSQTPNWMWDAPPVRYDQRGTFDRDTALANLNAHIDAVLGEYGDQLYSIDVVNEAVGTANPTDWKASLDKGEGWVLAIGWEWVELAFARAAKVVDENGWNVKLYYNDFGLNDPAKAQTVYAMVQDINARYAGTRPGGKQLIEGIGMQAHYNSSTKAEDVENTIALFSTLPGVSVSITEMDIEWPNAGTLTPEQAVAQGQKYAQLFQVFKKYAAGSGNTTSNPKVLERVTFWGVDDGSSWRSASLPLLFNAPSGTNVTAKEAFVAVQDPDAYLALNPVSDESAPQTQKSVDGVHVYDVSKGDSWSGANIILGNDASVWPWSTAGADNKIAFVPEPDQTYRLTVNYTAMGTASIRVRWVRDESNSGYTSQDGQVVSTSPYSTSLNPSQIATRIPAYFNSGMTNGNTYTLKTEIKLDGTQPSEGLIGNIAIRGGAGGNNFTINSLTVEKIGEGGEGDTLLVNWPDGIDEPGTEPEPDPDPEPEAPAIVIPPSGLTYENYPALKDVYEDYFRMGIFGAGETNALVYNFASYSPGNEMKPESTQSAKGTFTFSAADNAFNNLLNRNPNMLFYGHTLAWHSQSPTWMWDAPPARYGQPGTYDYDTALANLNNHIENVLEHFGGRLEGVDVVNEAVGTPDPNDWRASLAKGEGWYTALGSDWVELAFLKAAEVVDSHPEWHVKLIYNDFGLDSPQKARVVYEMVKDINERYADVRPNGKPLIEVIGMQAHYNAATNVADVESAIQLFATIPNININITEMDVGTPPIGVLTPENENNQAMKFAELFQVYKKYAAGPANHTNNPKVIDRISICGVRDATSGWRAGEFALLFTSGGLAKQALVAVLDPGAFLAAHDYILPDEGEEIKPIDGVYVYDASKGDAWSGANIVLGNDAGVWPWSTAGADGKVAFVPEQDATYRLSFNYTSNGTSSIRVRWAKDAENGNYTDADGQVVNSYPYSAGQVATHIPAYFNSGMVNAGSYTLNTEIKLDGSEPANGLIGNIAIRGGGGGNAFTLNWIKVEKIGAGGATDTLLVNWPEGIAEPEPGPLAGATLGGADSVAAGDRLPLVWGLTGVTGDVFAEELTVTYDADELELIAEPASTDESKFAVADYLADTPGVLRILGVHLGDWQTSPNQDLIKLSFRAKASAQGGPTDVTVTDLVVADGDGAETALEGATHTVNVIVISKSALNALIDEAQSVLNQAIEGKLIGQYPAGSKALLQTAINQALVVAGNQVATQVQIDAAAAQLDEALQAFAASVITKLPADYNNDNRVSVGDLAVMAKSYGATSADAGWEQIKQLDLNNDGVIDITDLAGLARMIFGW